jgi:hypothetical protein
LGEKDIGDFRLPIADFKYEGSGYEISLVIDGPRSGYVSKPRVASTLGKAVSLCSNPNGVVVMIALFLY